MHRRGIVIGKFWPPHRGHKYLIDTASAQVDQLTILVCDGVGQVPEATRRAEWLQEIHPSAIVRVIADTIDADDSYGWAHYTLSVLGYRPDVVFTSEGYGDAYAHYLGCPHVLVDRERTQVPISGTQVRQSPLLAWEYLEPPVRAYYALRICVLGAESTGTTTLAEALATHYKTVWVPEYGRAYSEKKLADGSFQNQEWTTAEFAHIAEEQSRQEDALAREANRVLICDTDAFATHVWHWRYQGYFSPEVEAISRRRRYALYILTDVDIPFIQDGLRDGEAIREEMHTVFLAELTRQNRPFIVVSGNRNERLQKAVQHIDQCREEYRG